MIKYIDVYKKKIKNSGSNMAESISNSTIYLNNKMFKEDISYREAYLNLDKKQKIDTRFRESKSDQFTKYFLTRPNEKITPGSYVTTKDGTFLVVEFSMDNIFPKVGTLTCNQIFNITKDSYLPVHLNNTTYGVKGSKDNDIFKEFDAKMKGYIQANDMSVKIYEGMRILIPNLSKHFIYDIDKKHMWVAYQVLKRDPSVIEGVYVLEMQLVPLSPLDDLENGIAYNDKFEEESIDEMEKIYGDDSLRINQIKKYEIDKINNPNIKFELSNNKAKILNSTSKICEIQGISNGITTLNAKINDRVIACINIMIYK